MCLTNCVLRYPSVSMVVDQIDTPITRLMVSSRDILGLGLFVSHLQMRDLVNRWSFLARKRFDTVMHWLFPNWWVPLYSSVTFSRMRYHLCIENKKWQDRVSPPLTYHL